MKRKSSRLVRVILCLLLFVSCLPSAMLAAEPPKEPILRIETGMHTAAINRISVDRENRLLATASIDKTVRIWDAGTGALIRLIRPPIGEGHEGWIYAVSLSPDGKTVAAGGITGYSDGTSKGIDFTIYIFDVGTGHLLRRLTGFPNTIFLLVFSPDGRYLVACPAGKYGIRVYRTSDFTLVGEDKDYGDISYGADFDPTGGLVTISCDGYLRRYDAGFRLVAKEKARGGKRPNAVRFSPNGQEVAVTFSDTAVVNVFSGKDLTFLFSPDAQGVNGKLGSVSWSADGSRLYAGGSYPKLFDGVWNSTIRTWSDGGRGSYADIPAGNNNTITDLQPRQGGGVFFGALDPSFGALDGMGKPLYIRNSVLGEYRNIEESEGFQVSLDGAVIRFSYEGKGKAPATFSLLERLLITGTTVYGDISLYSPRRVTPGLKVTEWKHTTAPKLNGTPLVHYPNESHRSLAVAPDGETFILGTDWWLRHFNARGKVIWQTQAPGTAWAVNITGDGRFAIAALGDGTIRWYNMKDGKEVLAFFPHKDQKRWVMWTPEGFFDASEGGAKLVGYHLNQGKDKEAIFIPMENLYDVFYRPDIVATKFKGEDISPLITLTAKEALKNPPPVAAFTTKITATDKSQIKVCCRISAKGGGIGEVRLFHNAKLIKSDGHYREYVRSKEAPIQLASLNSRAIQADQKRSIQVRFKEKSAIASVPKGEIYEDCTDVEAIAGENELSVAAFNKDNTVQGFLETMTFKASVAPVEPRVYVLIAGIDRYQDKSAKLNYAVKDAQDIHNRITAQLSTLFKKDQIHTVILTNEQVTRNKLLSTLDGLAKDIRPGDYFVLFTAGHGVLIQNQYYILTHDYKGDLDASCMIGSNEIVEATTKIKSLNQLLIFDTCHAGGMDNIVSGLYDARMAVMAKKMGLHIYASASSKEGAMDGYKGNGLFTHHLLKGLDNNIDADTNQDKLVSIVELGAYSKEQTITVSGKAGYRQTPMIINFGKDSPLYRLRKIPPTDASITMIPEKQSQLPMNNAKSSVGTSQPTAGKSSRDGRFIPNNDGTVLDTKTNLMWAARDNGENRDWRAAKSYCKYYRVGGYTDWRMPTQDELAGLYESGNYKNEIAITGAWVWASETRGFDAAYFYFTLGKRSWYPQSYDISTRALPVRSTK